MVSLLAAKILSDGRLKEGDIGGSTGEHNVVDVILGKLTRFFDSLIDRRDGLGKEIHIEILEVRTSELFREALNPRVEGLDFNPNTVLDREHSLGLFNFVSQSKEKLVVTGEILTGLVLVDQE